MVACDNWSPSLTFDVTPAFVQGDYLIKLVGPGNRQSYVPLTIWDPASTATYVIKNDVFTWQAWNFYGGYDYYQGLGSCPPGVYPICNRARVVSYDRPYAAENGSGNFLGLEYPLVRWAEQHGLDVTYATDLTVQEHPGYLLKHKVLLSLGHDECWSLGERQAAVRPTTPASTSSSSPPARSCGTSGPRPPRSAPTASSSTTGTRPPTRSTATAIRSRSPATSGPTRRPAGRSTASSAIPTPASSSPACTWASGSRTPRPGSSPAPACATARSFPASSPRTWTSSTRPTASPPMTRSSATRRSRPTWARPASARSSPT